MDAEGRFSARALLWRAAWEIACAGSSDEEGESMENPACRNNGRQQQACMDENNSIFQETKKACAASEGSLRFSKAKMGKTVNTAAMLAGREINVSGNEKFSVAERKHVAARYLPRYGPELVRRYSSRAYVGQFSQSGSFFVAGFQDSQILIFDAENKWALRKRIVARNLRWTITDTAISSDQRFLAYASITPIVHLVNVGTEGVDSVANVTDIHEGLSLGDDDVFGIWSLKFSQHGKELLAGANDSYIYVYDLERLQTTFRVEAHKDEVNAVAFADESNHVIFSGSDDNLCKVWDRRCLSACVGKLEGHLGGITYIDSRGDGRYFISNSKDQTLKLWDIRKIETGKRQKKKPPVFAWDYRYMAFPGRDHVHPNDASIMTYKGHEVLRTLIRCYFSPAFSTGQKYVYTGSHDGRVYIYDLVTGKIAERLEYHVMPVRDCSWHPWQPTLVSTCWSGMVCRWSHDKETRRAPKPVVRARWPYSDEVTDESE